MILEPSNCDFWTLRPEKAVDVISFENHDFLEKIHDFTTNKSVSQWMIFADFMELNHTFPNPHYADKQHKHMLTNA